ncbi:glycosyltransferase [Chenggangzhangella methanolivorans]|uniref:Glycosyltransferase n=1 Tax=Chenggangzhangella methanolivorans TaxID=1437009 RepID=A0A9E6RB03_9HYPH|nr:glycosyltransferase [Chenggangzhangella methanolivorans]QZO01463.1 glycosyltransferase [Chenggangzhangella methanolivorans]
MDTANKIFVGYDSREDIAWQVCRGSIERHASQEIPVYPLKQTTLRELGLYTRPADKGASTEFSLTRFLTPYLANTSGWSIFVDCDFLFTRDVNEVFQNLDPSKAVYVVQHEYTPAMAIKMDGKSQSVYPRKNWSSFIIFNGANEYVKTLTPDVVNASGPAHLHRFSWLPSDDLIGSLPLEWNFLVGEYDKPAATPAAIHYTNGGPWFENCVDVDYGDLWIAERDSLPARAAAE